LRYLSGSLDQVVQPPQGRVHSESFDMGGGGKRGKGTSALSDMSQVRKSPFAGATGQNKTVHRYISAEHPFSHPLVPSHVGPAQLPCCKILL
jgi:hypothetical protein